ncbi:MAG: S9 family peptidase [Bacteroidia bacterium]
MKHSHLKPPIAKVVPFEITKHEHTRIDNYYWFNERENPEVIAYLEAENAYTQQVMAHTNDLQEALYQEIKGKIKEDDNSVPYLSKGYYYYTRYETGKEYPIYCRKKGNLAAEEEVILEVNLLAEGKSFCQVMGLAVSTNGEWLAYGLDEVGRRICTIFFKNLLTGETLSQKIENATANFVWANDNQTIYYVNQDAETLRPFQVFQYRIHEQAEKLKSQLFYQENDDTFYVQIGKSRSEKYIFIESKSTISDEIRYISSDDIDGRFEIFEVRKKHFEYSIDHAEGYFYIKTNWKAKNFRLMRIKDTATLKSSNWEELIAHDADILLEDFELFQEYLVVEQRKAGLCQIEIRPKNEEMPYYIEMNDEAYMAYGQGAMEYESTVFRYGYQSMTTPASVFDYDMKNKSQILQKQQPVLGDFSPENYLSKRIWATAKDGTQVPISLVHRKDTVLDGNNPTVLYGYGSYGISLDAYFSYARLSLLDRGFVYAIAHIRGGSEMGRHWYESGKLLKKLNTFTDFIHCAEHLIAQNYTNPQKLFAMGGSAGGLLMGAVMNMRPDLWKGIVAQVPFVDVVTTMLDDTIPLTTGEYDEWGNPNDKKYYKYMLRYSPMDNVKAKKYPNVLIMSGLHDSQVQYFEPTKWAAKLRVFNKSKNVILLHTNMEAGHGGASGRFQALREVALEYAFLLECV